MNNRTSYSKQQAVEFWKDRTYREVKIILESTCDSKEFFQACNALTNPPAYVVDFYEDSLDKLRKIANDSIRNRIGYQLRNMLGDVIARSGKSECNDELYKLYSFDYIPDYLRTCIKVSLKVLYETWMHITTIDGISRASSYILTPPCCEVCTPEGSDPAEYKDAEMEIWNKAARVMLRGGRWEVSYRIIDKALKKCGRDWNW